MENVNSHGNGRRTFGRKGPGNHPLVSALVGSIGLQQKIAMPPDAQGKWQLSGGELYTVRSSWSAACLISKKVSADGLACQSGAAASRPDCPSEVHAFVRQPVSSLLGMWPAV